MLAEYLQSVIRSVVPVAVAAVVSFGLRYGVHLDEGATADLLGALVGSGYYALVRWAEEKFPNLGWLLGKPGTPSYGSAGD
ncbi:hypothetical protein [Terracoccus sp. 273MFTsu3.1]|uniref:hypothetical protein n=1 Tax=Terracoccus sp. 273MFTsu3.1 TaxID=1172188 RepID=UPI000360F849|nr:hypothetical protein [Terracoccus sp. 273MFTsu3.1]